MFFLNIAEVRLKNFLSKFIKFCICEIHKVLFLMVLHTFDNLFLGCL